MADPEIGPAPVLRDPANLVSPRARVVWRTGAAIRAIVPFAVALVLALTGVWDLPLWVWILYVAIALSDIVLMPIYRYRVHRWETTATAVYTQTGWIARERRIAPMSRVQTVDLEQSVVGRVLGLATVTVTTASAAGPLRIEGLDLATAERLVDDLTRCAEDEAGDAT
ncbi:MAG: PH domain-containing protein [Marmoricola sp.]